MDGGRAYFRAENDRDRIALDQESVLGRGAASTKPKSPQYLLAVRNRLAKEIKHDYTTGSGMFFF